MVAVLALLHDIEKMSELVLLFLELHGIHCMSLHAVSLFLEVVEAVKEAVRVAVEVGVNMQTAEYMKAANTKSYMKAKEAVD